MLCRATEADWSRCPPAAPSAAGRQPPVPPLSHGGLVIARLGGMSGPPSLPGDVGLGIATPDEVPELLALWAVAAENDSRPGIRPRRYSHCSSATPEHASSRGRGTASSVRSLRAGTDGARTCTGWRSIRPYGAGASARHCSTRGQRDSDPSAPRDLTRWSLTVTSRAGIVAGVRLHTPGGVAPVDQASRGQPAP